MASHMRVLMWGHAYITYTQINYTCAINSPSPSSPLMYKLSYKNVH